MYRLVDAQQMQEDYYIVLSEIRSFHQVGQEDERLKSAMYQCRRARSE